VLHTFDDMPATVSKPKLLCQNFFLSVLDLHISSCDSDYFVGSTSKV
jgi:hypothetical protein